jgi:hypothetical protein
MAIAALMIQQVGKSAATTALPSAPALGDADLRAEGRILDTYVDDLVVYGYCHQDSKTQRTTKSVREMPTNLVRLCVFESSHKPVLSQPHYV